MILDNKIKNEFNATLRSICFSNIESNPDSTSQMLLELYLFKDSESNDTLVSRIAKLMDNMSAPSKANISKPDNPARVASNHRHGTEPCV